MSDKPQFTHDCAACMFLGRWNGPMHEDNNEDSRDWDLYVCQGTVVARYSNNGPDYTSGLTFAKLNLIMPLVEALKRAEAKGITIQET
jgi:hypothetical protein